MPNPLTYNSSTSPTGTFKRSNISYGLMPTNYGTGYSNLTWYNSLDTASKYVIVSDTYTLGYTTQGNAKPVMWSTGNTTNQNLIDLINGLPGNTTNFTDYYAAVNWLQGTNKYFLLNDGYENIVTNGLVLNLDAAWWNSYPTSGTTWTDLSGSGNNGALTNGPTYDTLNGGSIVFDGTNDYINLPNGLLLGTGDFTIIQWVQSNGAGVGTTFGNYPSGTLQFGWSNSYVFLWLDNQSAYASTSNFTTAITMIAGRRIGTTTNYIKNGVVLSTGSSNASIGNSSANFRIGINILAGEQYNGKIYTTLVYNRGLSDSEILQVYNAQKGRFGL